jgi:anti-sigma B factor antagonist
MPDDSFPVAELSGVPVVTAPAEIDITNVEALGSALRTASARGRPAVVVDLTRTRFCDVSGLHALSAAHWRAEAEGRTVLLVIGSPAVKRVLALTELDAVIRTLTSLAEALALAVRPHALP